MLRLAVVLPTLDEAGAIEPTLQLLQALRAAGDWTSAPPDAALWIQVGTDWRACPHP